MTMNKQGNKDESTNKTKTSPEKENVLTKDKFLKLLDKAIQPVQPQKKRPAKGKKKTSE
jgi:hypothetical protein